MNGHEWSSTIDIRNEPMLLAGERTMHDQTHYLLTEIQHNVSKGAHEYTDVLSWAFKKIGIVHFSYVYVGYLPSEVDKAVIMGNYPKDWVETYESMALFRNDPIINHSSTTSTAFFWEEAVRGNHNSKHIFEMSAQYGIEQGFTIPVHEPGCAFGSLHLACNKENSEFKKIIQKNLYLITTISYLAHQHRPYFSRQKPYPDLTEREAECLHWIAIGKSYGEIALILGISERTIKFHAKNITEKMDAINVKQAMTKAIRMNYI